MVVKTNSINIRLTKEDLENIHAALELSLDESDKKTLTKIVEHETKLAKLNS